MQNNEIKLPKLLNDGCVLQQEKARIWGWYKTGCEIWVEFQGIRQMCTADNNGRFEIELEELTAGGPFIMRFCAEDGMEKEIREVYVGDVFVCSGQSNMELPMRRVKVKYPEEYQNGGCAGVHLYKVKECVEFSFPLEDHKEAGWSKCTGENLAEISAFSYFFGKYLHEKTGNPVGIINLSLGGTPAEAWTSKEGLAPYPELLEIRKQYQSREYRNQIVKNQEQAEEKWYSELEKQVNSAPDNVWKEMQIPCYFSEQGLEHFCGQLWLKKKFYVDKDTAGKRALLNFGTLVDSDRMYINNIFVGETTYCYPPRRYEIQENILKEGENELLIRLTCRDGKGRVTPGKVHEIVSETGVHIPLDGTWKYQIKGECEPAPVQNFINHKPTGLFQGMTAPCLSYKVKGVVWYQGESNDCNPDSYEMLLKGMIEDWRMHWKQEKLPFIVIQLPNCAVDIAGNHAWSIIRNAQKQAEQLEDVAVTVNLDLGEDNDLHPLRKKDAAYRAFLAAEKLIYKENVVCAGPELVQYKKTETEILLQFDTKDGKPICIKDEKELKEFEVAKENGEFYFTQAELEGNIVRVKCDAKAIKKLRYAWSDAPQNGLLCNQSGLLTSPFCIECCDETGKKHS